MSMKSFKFLMLLSVVFSCKKKSIDDFETIVGNTKNYSEDLTVHYEHSKICINELISYDKSSVQNKVCFIKLNDGYYQYSKNSACFNVSNKNVIISLKNNIYSSFDCIDGRHEFYIVKLDSNYYVSVENVYGIKDFRRLLFYDKNFKIIRIEKQYADKKLVFINTSEKVRRFSIPETEFIKKLKKDSTDYHSGIFIEH